MDKNKIIKKAILDLVSKSNLEGTISILDDINKSISIQQELESELVVQASRLEDIKKQNRNGVITGEDYSTRKNQITQSIIDIVEEYHVNGIFARALNSNCKLKLLSLLQIEERLTFLEDDVVSLFSLLDDITTIFRGRKPEYDWHPYWDSQIEQIRGKWEERRFQIAILALVKAGKSTLLNAWIGNEYLPSGALPETMQVTRIRHNQSNHEGILYINNVEKEIGVTGIRKYLRTLNDESRENKENKKDEYEARLEVNLSVLKRRKLSGYGFDILDTPGVNEFGVETLHSKIETIGRSADVIIFLIDFTKLRTKDEAQMFENIRTWRKELLSQLKSRLFFVVNKIDVNNRHDREKKMSPEEIKKYVAKILLEYASIRSSPEDIILVSAELALLSRLVDNGIATKEQLYDFKIKAFGEIGVDDATNSDCMKAVPKLVAKSGFEELEKRVLDLIYSNRSFIFFRSLLDDVEKTLFQINNNLEVSKGTLESNQKAIDDLKKKIAHIRKNVDHFSIESSGFKKKAEEIIHKRLKEFRKSVSKIVSDAFARTASSTRIYNKNIISTVFAANSLFGSVDFEVRDSSKESLLRKLDLINRYVIESIENQFDLIWGNIIEDIYSEYLQLKDALLEKSIPIIRQIEETINETFEIKLNPSDFTVKNPTFIRYYKNMQYDLSSIIRDRFALSGDILADLFNILKNTALFFMNDKNVHKVTTIDYKKKISKTTEGVISEATIIADDFIRTKYLKTVDEAKDALSSFIDRYISIIEQEISNKRAKITNIPARIRNVKSDIETTQDTIFGVSALKQLMEEII